MKTIVTSVLAALLLLFTPGADAARKRPRKPPRVRLNKAKQVRPKPSAVLPVSLAAHADEVQLSPAMVRRLQSNLIDGGYLGGRTDGHLTPRTRRAIAAFQAEYRLPSVRGALDRATADALLGRETIDHYLVTRHEKRPGAHAPGRHVAARR
jgi:peptidoglycan hydrolase-like protein with peptidoglycan-binding domain